MRSRLQITYAPELVAGLRTPGLSGDYTPRQALDALLKNSGLVPDYVSGNTVVLRRAKAAPKSSPSRVSRPPDEVAELETIVVTGSQIRDIGPSAGTRVDVIDRDEIERSGYGNLPDLIKSIPQNLGSGATEDTTIGGSTAPNLGMGTAVNLRGLGTNTTLLLINGRRVPMAGLGAEFFDLSSIPVSAIDRVEILSDGASAVYGADAIAGVVNVILREDYEGAETRLRYGTVTSGSSQEYQFGQAFGKSWQGGHALISYEYFKRDALRNKDRDFTASSDLRRLGGDDFRTLFSNPGNILDPVTGQPLYAIPRGQDGTALNPADLLPGQVNLANDRDRADSLPSQERNSVFATVAHDLTDSIELFADARYSDREFGRRSGSSGVTLTVPSSNPFFVDPFGGSSAVTVAYNLVDDLPPLTTNGDAKTFGATLGGNAKLGGDWRLRLFGAYSSEQVHSVTTGLPDFPALNQALADPDPATAFNPFGDGSHTNPATLARIATTQTLETTSKVKTVNAIADGSLFHIPGGDVKIAVGTEYRRESFKRLVNVPPFVELQRDVLAGFGEISIPLVGPDNKMPGIERLVISAAVRVDDYRKDRRDDVTKNIGSTTNPKLGISWDPVKNLTIRGSWGTSFRASDLPTVGQTGFAFVQPVPDPTSATGDTFAIVRAGTDPNLKNEEAVTWTVGFDAKPEAFKGLGFSLTYVNIEFEDRIATPNTLAMLANEDRFAGLFIRDPSAEQINAICNDPAVFIFQPPSICQALPIGAIIDFRTRNAARTEVRAVDFAVDYGFDTNRIGRFDIQLNGSYILDFKQSFSPQGSLTDVVGTVANPVGLRMRNSVTWSGDGGLSASAFLNYTDDYRDDLSAPERRIASWTTVDLTMRYDTSGKFASQWLDNTSVILSALNVFDRGPPFVNNATGIGYDPENADPLGRFISLSFVKNW